MALPVLRNRHTTAEPPSRGAQTLVLGKTRRSGSCYTVNKEHLQRSILAAPVGVPKKDAAIRSGPRSLASWRGGSHQLKTLQSKPACDTSVSDCCYLVDPASSHMLVSKIKPCMSKYKPLYGETADGSLKQLLFP